MSTVRYDNVSDEDYADDSSGSGIDDLIIINSKKPTLNEYYVTTNINTLAANGYPKIFFKHGKLQEDITKGDIKKTREELQRQFYNERIAFTCDHPKLTFNDFVYLNNLDLDDPLIQIVLMILRYGSDCDIYLDRTTLRYVVEGGRSDKQSNGGGVDIPRQNVSRAVKKLFDMTEKEMRMKNNSTTEYKPYPSIETAKLASRVEINTSLYNFVHNQFATCRKDGFRVTPNYFITKIISCTHTKFAEKIYGHICDILKTTTDFSEYVQEVNRLQHVANMIKQKQTDNNNNNENNIIDDFCNINLRVRDISDMGPSCSNGKRRVCEFKTPLAPSPSKHHRYDDDNISSNDEEENGGSDSDSGVSSSAASSCIKRNVCRRTPRVNIEELLPHQILKEEMLNPTCIYFRMIYYVNRLPITRVIAEVLRKSCFTNDMKGNDNHSILLYYNPENKTYRFVLRLVKTARNRLTKEKGDLICGWSGMHNMPKKPVFLRCIKEMHNNNFTMSRGFITKVKDLDKLIVQVTSLVERLHENPRETTSSSSTSQLENTQHSQNIIVSSPGQPIYSMSSSASDGAPPTPTNDNEMIATTSYANHNYSIVFDYSAEQTSAQEANQSVAVVDPFIHNSELYPMTSGTTITAVEHQEGDNNNNDDDDDDQYDEGDGDVVDEMTFDHVSKLDENGILQASIYLEEQSDKI